MKKQTKRPRRHFSDEFKLEAVELSKNLGITGAAKELGINESQIRYWKKKKEEPGSAGLESKSYSDLEKEVRRLSKENGYLKEINKVLKKSTAIFSSDHMGGLK